MAVQNDEPFTWHVGGMGDGLVELLDIDQPRIANEHDTLKHAFGKRWDPSTLSLHGLVASAIVSGTKMMRDGREGESQEMFRKIEKLSEVHGSEHPSIFRLRAVAFNNLGCLKCRYASQIYSLISRLRNSKHFAWQSSARKQDSETFCTLC